MNSACTTPEERRQFQRILFEQPLTVLLNGRYHDTLLIDISLRGALVKRPLGWPTHDEGKAILEIALSDADSIIRMEAEIAHQDRDKVGFHTRFIDMESMTHLRRLVELNVGDPQLLERELAALG